MLMKIWLLFFGLIPIAFPQAVFGQASKAYESMADGPYIFYEDGRAIARWVEGGELREAELEDGKPLEVPPSVSPSFQEEYLRLNDPFEAQKQVSFDGVERVLAISDIHGQYGLLLRLLKTHGVIDQATNWSFGKGHLVILGDIFDRGDGVAESLWLVHKLEQQAEQAGGRVHYLLGNHEVMVLQGDLRYIHHKYRYTMAALKKSYEKLFGEDTYLGRWLRSKPVAISINRVAYVHGGISEAVLQQGLSFEEMNAAFQYRILRESEEAIMADPVLSLLYNEEGPVWYRGYFEEGFDKKQAKHILRQIGNKRIVVGHTSFREIISLFNGKVICIDSSIKLGKNGEVLLLEGRKLYKGALNGEKIRLK